MTPTLTSLTLAVILRLFMGGAPIRDKLSSLVVPDPDLDPAPDCDLSSVKMPPKTNQFFAIVYLLITF